MDASTELILRYFRRRWWSDVDDLVDATTDERLAFDELELADDVDELARAVGIDAVERFALAGLAREPIGGPELVALETEPARARAFVAIVSVSLAFQIRSDRLLDALVRSADLPPRLDPAKLGELLVRSRSARDARARLSSLPEAIRDAALASLRSNTPTQAPPVVHVRATERETHSALEHVLGKKGLEPVVWIARVASDAGRRLIVLRERGGWTPVIAPRGVERELAVELARARDVRATAWVHLETPTLDFEVREGANVVDSASKLAARLKEPPTDDDVMGALRSRGIEHYDPLAEDLLSLKWEDYSPLEGAPASPSVLKALKVTGLAFAAKAAAADERKARAKARRKRER